MHEEVAFIAVGLGWSYNDILSFTHYERNRWVKEVNRINTRHNHILRKRYERLLRGTERDES